MSPTLFCMPAKVKNIRVQGKTIFFFFGGGGRERETLDLVKRKKA